MRGYDAEYKEKSISIDEVLSKIHSGDSIFSGLYGGEAAGVLRRLHEIAPRVENVTLWKANDMEIYPVLEREDMTGHIETKYLFYGQAARAKAKKETVDYYPNDLHLCMPLKNGCNPSNVLLVSVSPMDEEGYFHLGSWMQMEREALDAAETVIVEVNRNVPRVTGDTGIHISQVTWIVENDRPLPVLDELPVSDVEEAIGEHIAEMIHDGDCLQLGIGGIPNVAANKLMDKKHLGIHTEMFTDSMMKLMKAGVVDNSCKTLNPGIAVASFARGTRELYDFLDRNPEVVFKSCVYTNNPFVIAQNDNMVSINTCMELDLTGQICSESIGHRQYSGTGGAFDFAYGALHSKGGRGIIAIPSTAKNGTISKIRPLLTEGAMVSITRNVIDNVVTEYGVAPLRGRTVQQRVNNLIAVAHPDFRDELRAQARYLMLW